MGVVMDNILFTNDADIVRHHTRRYFEESADGLFDFSKRLFYALARQGLHGRLPLDKAAEKRFENSAMKAVSRILDGERIFPLDWLGAWSDELPDFVIEKIRRDRGLLHGVLTVPIVGADEADISLSALSSIMKEFSEFLAAAAPVAGDGKIDEQDSTENLLTCRNELADVLIIGTSELNRLNVELARRVKEGQNNG